MKKFLLSILAMVCATVVAFAGEYTIEFKDNGAGKSDGTAAFTSDAALTDIIASGSEHFQGFSSGGYVYPAKEGFGIKFSNSSNAGSLTLLFNEDSKQKITQIVATAAAYNGSKHPIITINDKAVEITDAELADYTFEYTPETVSSSVAISFGKENGGDSRGYISKLVITYEDEQTEEPEQPTANNAISFSGNPASVSTQPQYRLDVDHTVLPGVTTQEDLRTKSVSVGAWVNVNTYGRGCIMNYGGNNHNNSGGFVEVATNTAGNIVFKGFGVEADLGLGVITLDQVIPTNEWHYVAFAVDFENGEFRTYYDGERQTTGEFDAANVFREIDDSPYGFSFGRVIFDGAFDEIHIVDGAISDWDAQALYKNHPLEVENLVGWYNLDEVAEGTTAQFANKVEGNTTPAINNSLRGTSYSWSGGILECTPTEAAATIVEGREIVTSELDPKPVPATKYAVTFTQPEEGGSFKVMNGDEELTSGAEVEENTELTIVPAAEEGYELEAVKVNDVALEGEYTFTVTEATTIEVTFKAEEVATPEYTIEVATDENGTVALTVDGEPVEGKIAEGSIVTVTVTPADGYEIEKVMLGEEELTAENGVYTFEAKADATITVTFKEIEQPAELTYIEFDGTTQYMRIPHSDDFDIAAGGTMTVSAKVQLDQYGVARGIVSNRWHNAQTSTEGNGSTSGFDICAGESATNNWSNNINVNQGQWQGLGHTWRQGIALGEWKTVTWVYDGANGTSKLYLDGVLSETVTRDQFKQYPINPEGDMLVGARYNTSAYPITIHDAQLWDGKIADVRFYNAALTDDQVANIDKVTENLIAAYNFADITGTEVADISGNGHTGYLVGFGEETETFAVTFTQPEEGGSFKVMNGDEEIASGDEVEAETELTIVPTAEEGYVIEAVKVNDQALDGEYTFTVAEATTIEVSFKKEETEEPEPVADYCYAEGTSAHNSQRGITTFTISDNKGNSLTVDGPGAGLGHTIYIDQTANVFNTVAGATLSFNGTAGNTEWMHNFVYIDFDNNGVFDVDQSIVGLNGELVSYSGYTLEYSSSKGDTVDPTEASDGSATNNGNYFAGTPDYTLPIDLAPGTYRLRLKNDWNSTDPCGRSADHLFGQQSGNYITSNGGSMIDILINVEAAPVSTLTVECGDNGALTITDAKGNEYADGDEVAVGTQLTIIATPEEGYALTTLCVMSAESEDIEMLENGATITMAESLVIAAQFGKVHTLTVVKDEDVEFALTAGGIEITDLTALQEEVEYDLTVTVPSTKDLVSVTLGEEELTAAEGVYTFTLTDDATLTIVAETKKARYAVNIEQPENGAISVFYGEGEARTEVTTGDELTEGTILSFETTPEEGYLLDFITVDGEQLETETLTLAGEVTISAQFKVKPAIDETNMALSFAMNPSSVNTSPQYRLDVDATVLPGVTTQADLVSQSVSVGAWVKVSEYNGVIMNYGGLAHNNNNGFFTVRPNASGALLVDGYGVKDSNRLNIGAFEFGANLPLNEWHHVALAVDFENKQIRTYLDGEIKNLVEFTADSFGPAIDDSLYGFGFGTYAFTGEIDEVQIFNAAITNAEAAALAEDAPEAVQNLVGWYDLNAVAEGTDVATFNNLVADNDQTAKFYRLTSSTNWGDGILYISRNEDTAPTFVPGREIALKELANERTITVASANEELGSVAITNPAAEGNSITTKTTKVTVTATPVATAAFINWTNANNEVVAETATYVYSGEEDVELTANFGFAINATLADNNGSYTLLDAEGNAVNGTVIVPDTELTLTVAPNTGYGVNVTINDEAIALTNNTYTFTPEANADIVIAFFEKGYMLNVEIQGLGEVVVASTGTKASFPEESTWYTPGEELPNGVTTLRVFVKPAEGNGINNFRYESGSRSYVYDYTDANADNKFVQVTAAGYEDWFYLQTSVRVEDDVNISVVFSTEGLAGIDAIFSDAAQGEVEYYNLQGVRVAAENLTPGFYIVRKGNESHKIYINE